MTTTISPALDAASKPAPTSPAIIPAARTMVRRLPDLEAEPPALPLPRQPPTIPPDAVPETAAPAPPDSAAAPTSFAPDRARLQAHLTLRLIVEVLDGRRPAAQLGGTVTDPVLRYVVCAAGRLDEPRSRAAHPGRRHTGHRRESSAERVRGAGLRSMRVCHPAEGVAEVSVVWRHRGRFRALAARFELPEPDPAGTARPPAEPRWRCTALRVG